MADAGGTTVTRALSPGVFTVDQRRRLEAVTAGRALVGTGPGTTIQEWLRVAEYIEKGVT